MEARTSQVTISELFYAFYNKCESALSIAELNKNINDFYNKNPEIFNNFETIEEFFSGFNSCHLIFDRANSIEEMSFSQMFCMHLVYGLKPILIKSIGTYDELVQLPNPAIMAILCGPNPGFEKYIQIPFQFCWFLENATFPELKIILPSIRPGWFESLFQSNKNLIEHANYLGFIANKIYASDLSIPDDFFLKQVSRQWLKKLYEQAYDRCELIYVSKLKNKSQVPIRFDAVYIRHEKGLTYIKKIDAPYKSCDTVWRESIQCLTKGVLLNQFDILFNTKNKRVLSIDDLKKIDKLSMCSPGNGFRQFILNNQLENILDIPYTVSAAAFFNTKLPQVFDELDKTSNLKNIIEKLLSKKIQDKLYKIYKSEPESEIISLIGTRYQESYQASQASYNLFNRQFISLPTHFNDHNKSLAEIISYALNYGGRTLAVLQDLKFLDENKTVIEAAPEQFKDAYHEIRNKFHTPKC